jgi:hypothetical protein
MKKLFLALVLAAPICAAAQKHTDKKPDASTTVRVTVSAHADQAQKPATPAPSTAPTVPAAGAAAPELTPAELKQQIAEKNVTLAASLFLRLGWDSTNLSRPLLIYRASVDSSTAAKVRSAAAELCRARHSSKRRP